MDRRTAACLPASDSTPVWFFYYHLDVRKLLGASSKEHFINTFTQLSGFIFLAVPTLLVILYPSDQLQGSGTLFELVVFSL